MKNFKKLLAMVLAIILVISAVPSGSFAFIANAITAADLTYEIADNAVTITGYNSASGEIEIPSEIEGYPVTAIGYEAFKGCTTITGITIPDTVTSIANYAFSGCTKLASVDLSENITTIGYNAFKDCKLLANITLPKGLTAIGSNTFSGCTVLSSVDIPDSVTSIGASAFYYCQGLKTVTIGNGVKELGDEAFRGCSALTNIVIPSSVTKIGQNAFNSCTSLSSITIGNGVKSIAYRAFYNCTALKNVIYYGTDAQWSAITFGSSNDAVLNATTYRITDSAARLTKLITTTSGDVEILAEVDGYPVTSISDEAVRGCTAITSVIVPSSVKTIGQNAFNGCTGLTTITLGNEITNIGYRAFYNCTALTDVIYNGTEEQWNAITFGSYNDPLTSANITFAGEDAECTHTNTTNGICSDCGYNTILDYISYEIVDDAVTITDCDESISGAFETPSEIEGYPVTSIGDAAFINCKTLTSIIVSKSIISIGYRAFLNCIGLTEINVSENNSMYTSQDGVLFNKNITSLIQYPAGKIDTTFTIPDTVTTIGSYAFSHCDNLTRVTIPNGVISIGVYAFSRCNSLTEITIPDSVSSIDSTTFYCCSSLAEINVGENNSYYTSQNGILFDKDITTIKRYPAGKLGETYVIPDSVTCIDPYSFGYCDSLISIDIHNNVGSIGNAAFEECDSLTNVTYTGTEEQWNAISIGEYNDPLTSANITFAGEDAECTHTNVVDGNVIVEGDCTTDRVVEQFCADCGEVLENKVIAAEGHTEGDPIAENDIEPTCTTSGSYDTVIYCTLCDTELLRESTIVDALGHFEADPVIENEIAPTCTTGGSYDNVVYCTVCGEELSRETIFVEPTDHNCNDTGICLDCGYNTILDYISYEIVYGEVTITDCDESISGAFEIPSEIKGYPVTSISDYAFADCTSLDIIIFSDNVTSIGNGAFINCTSLTNIIIPDRVTSVGEWTFTNCTSLTEITISDSVTSIGDRAFQNCSNLIEIAIPNSVTSIGYGAFCDCISLTDVIFNGTKAQWNAIIIGDENDPLLNANITFAVCEHDWSNADGVCASCGEECAHEDIIETTTVTEPTCTEDGTYKDTCTICGLSEVYGGDDAIGHNLAPVPQYDPTCCSIGKKAHNYCWRCGNNFSFDETDIYSTDYVNNSELEIAIDPDNHQIVTFEAIEPTCTEGGILEFVYCELCYLATTEDGSIYGTITIDQEVYDAEYQADILPQYEALYNATFETREEYLAAVKAIVDQENALKDKYFKAAAVDAGFGFDALGHTEGEVVVENYVAGNCTTDMSYDNVVYCTVCGEELSRERFTIGTPGHSWFVYFDDNNHWEQCNACGETRNETAHDLHVTEHGTSTETWCSGCDYSLWSDIVTSCSHNGYWYYDTTYHWVDCEKCGTTTTAVRHRYDGELVHWCEECGFCPQQYGDLAYLDGTITAYLGRAYDNNVVIPSTIYGETITAIGEYAFSATETNAYVENITSITIPNTVNTIENGAFGGCKSLTSVIFEGTEEQWNAISIADGNDPLLNANITFTVTETPTIVVSNAVASNGQTVDVTISLVNNPGISLMKLLVSYDSDILELVSYKDGVFTPMSYGSIIVNPFAVNWSGGLNDSDGIVTTLTFKIKEGAIFDSTAITVSTDNDSTTGNDVYFDVQNGSITMCKHTDTYSTTENNVAPDCVNTGSYQNVVYCNECGDEVSRETVTVDALGHTAGKEVVYNENVHWNLCTVCGEATNEVEHTMVDIEVAGGIESSCTCGYIIFTAKAADESGNVGIDAEPGAFPVGTEIIFDLIDELDGHYDIIEDILRDVGSNFVAYNVTPSNPLNDGKEAEISFAIPEDFGSDVAIYYVNEQTGEYERLETQVRDGRAHARTNHFSIYVLVDESEAEITDSATFVVETEGVVVTGSTITVTISAINNPGIISTMLELGYDTDVLELVSAEGVDFDDVNFGPLANEPLKIFWADATGENHTDDGVVATLTFNVKEGATIGDTQISLGYDSESTFNYDLEYVTFETQGATVKVVDYLAGDVNGDGLIDMMDTGLMKRYILGWDVEINVDAADVNADGLVNNMDYVLLGRYIAGWDVELKYYY